MVKKDEEMHFVGKHANRLKVRGGPGIPSSEVQARATERHSPGFIPTPAKPTEPTQPLQPQPKVYKDSGSLGKNLTTLNNALAAGEATPEQAAKIQSINERSAPTVGYQPLLSPGQTTQTLTDPGGGGTLTHSGQRGSDRVPVGRDGLPLQQGLRTRSGLSVEFDDNVPQAARQAFMTDPAKPAPVAQHMLPRDIVVNTKQNLNTTGMGWKARTALQTQLLKNQGDMEQQESANRAALMRDQADPTRAAQTSLYNAQALKYGQEVEAQRMDNKMQGILTDPKSTPAQREQAMQYYQGLKAKTETSEKPRIFPGQAIDKLNPETNRIESSLTPPTVVEQDESGRYVTRYADFAETTPTMPTKDEARAYLNNPEMKQYFSEIYGMELEDYLAQ